MLQPLDRFLTTLEPAASAPLPRLAPPPRFGLTRFVDYDPQHPSQNEALTRVRSFVDAAAAPAGFRWPWQGPEPGRGLYLDGGFGVGKTHLLAAAWHAFDTGPKGYLAFSELVGVIGALGKTEAQARLGRLELLCLDEFELDDPGNTLIVKTFLAPLFERGGWVVTTSNTPPEAQGQGRFNAHDFQREIQSIAERFEVVAIGGPDYRHRDHLAELAGPDELDAELARDELPAPRIEADWETLFAYLRETHPLRYRSLLERTGTLVLRGVAPIPTQNDALRFVHFIDKLYDLRVVLRATGGIPLEALFDPSYRHSAYAKKHFRCLSRLSELLEERPEARDLAPRTEPPTPA